MIQEERRGDFSWPTEVTRFEQAQGGDADSLNELMQQHERLVHWVVHRQWLLTLPYEEAVQAGRRGLYRAILGYDPKRGVRFATYACQAIMKYVWKAVKSERRRIAREVPLGILVLYYDQPGVDPALLRDRRDIRESLMALVKRLPKRLGTIIHTYYGLKGDEPQTMQVIGERLGVTRERVRQLRNDALLWLRQPAHSQELRSLLARHDQQQYELADQLAQAWLRKRGGRRERRKTHP
jgi:RNA polymerase sigma factor (sigma-70 family)